MRIRGTRLVLVGSYLVLAAAGPVAAQTPSLLDNVLPPGHVFCDPVHPHCVFAALQMAGIPVGIELENPLPQWPVPDVPFEFGGMTVRALLDKGIEADKRYEWREINGVPVMRLKEAWRDPRDPLSRPLPEPLVLKDVNLDGALDALEVAVYGGVTEPRAEKPTPDNTRFSVRISSGSLLGAINAIALAHGRLTWGLVTMHGDHPSVSFWAAPNFRGAGGMLLKPMDLQTEYVGKLKPGLQPASGDPSCRLAPATPKQIAALPVPM